MNARPASDPRFADLTRAVAEAAQMIDRPALFTAEEVLGQLLAATRLAFDIAGVGEEETQRRHLYRTIADYIDVPPLLLGTSDRLCQGCSCSRMGCTCGASWPREDEAASDFISAFLAANVTFTTSSHAAATDLFERYAEWRVEHAGPKLSPKQLSRALTDRGYQKVRSNGVRWQGIRLRPAPIAVMPPIEMTRSFFARGSDATGLSE